jgi:hypothetical protein
MPQWGAVADTGSLEPSPEAALWARRAEAWAQQPAPEQAGQWEQPASRWADVAPTGRQTYPPDGVGWRTETAEWLAVEQTARWRQTTEWRSASGDHGWRSTTEAWQTGGSAEGFQPPTAPPTRQQLAISSTAWPTPQSDDPPATGQETPQSYSPPSQSASWQVTEDPPAWQQAAEGRPAWQQFAAPPSSWQPHSSPPAASAPTWQQPQETWQQPQETWQQPQETWQQPQETWQQPQEAWRQPQDRWQQPLDTSPAASAPPASQTPDDSPSWQRLIEPTPAWQQPVDPAPPWQPAETRPVDRPVSDPSWPTTAAGSAPYAGTWSGGLDDGRHLVREDDRARWRREAASGMAGPGGRAIGRRRAADPGAGSGGTGWAASPDSDNWAGHTDTGSMPIFPPPAAISDRPGWRDRAEAPALPARAEAPDWRDKIEAPGWRDRAEAPDWRDRAEAAGWQREDAPSWQRDETRRQRGDRPSWETRRQRDDRPSWQRDETRWQRDETPSWRDSAEAPGWQREESPSWQGDETRRQLDDRPSWQREADWRNESDSWRAEPDSGSWSRGEAPRSGDGRRRTASADENTDAPSWGDAGPNRDAWRRGSGPAADPWAPNVSDTGRIPMSWEQPATDTGSWRSAPQDRPYGARQRFPDDDQDRADAPLDPDVWRRDPGPRRDGRNWPAEEIHADWLDQLREEQRRELPPAGEAVTEIRQRIDPETWQRLRRQPGAWQDEQREQSGRGSATYREGSTGDWRRELAAETELADGEARRYGTQDFVPFRTSGSAPVPSRPSGSASVPTSAASAPASARNPRDDLRAGPLRGREELVVGNGSGSARWQDPPDTRWPPRGAATGSYERRAVGALPTSSGRSNLLEPDDDEIEENTGGPLAAVGYTVIWYGVPVVLFVLYMLVLNGNQQAHALSTLASAAPQFGLSLVLSMVVAVGLRWASGSWKAASVGLAAAVMGGGLATVLTSAITGNSLS